MKDLDLFSCMVKQLLGVECPLGGFQRSVVALWNGQFYKSLLYYPALIPLLITICILGLYFFYPKPSIIKIFKYLLILDLVLILGFFFLKLAGIIQEVQ